MKIDAIEIFQTIRASLQPYATEGFSNRINSEETYDLWSEKNLEIDGSKVTETFFSGVKIIDDNVAFSCYSVLNNKVEEQVIVELTDLTVKQIENDLSQAYKEFVERGWI
jgi:hypothetical protein